MSRASTPQRPGSVSGTPNLPEDGIGHKLPGKAPGAFADAVLQVGGAT